MFKYSIKIRIARAI